jgi:hypothetical protein
MYSWLNVSFPVYFHLNRLGNDYNDISSEGHFENSKLEPLFVDVYEAQESIPPGWESTPGLLKKFTNMGSREVLIHY